MHRCVRRRLGSFRIAHLSTGDRIGVEIFEFRNAEKPRDNFEYWKTGIFHFCVQDPDVEGLAARVVAAGGKQRMPVREYFPGEKPFRMVYMEDPSATSWRSTATAMSSPMLQVPTSEHHHQGGAPKQAPRLPNAPALVPLCKSACTRITAGRLGTAVQHISSADGKSAKMLGSSQAKCCASAPARRRP